MNSLNIHDIEGAKASTKGLGVFAVNHQRKEFRNSLDIKDIDGAHSGSLKKCPQTKRCYNPLNP